MRAFFLSLICFLCCPVFSNAEPPSEEYILVWTDEFDGTRLDTTKWDYRALGPRRDAINVKNTVALDGEGNLVLTTKRVGDKYHTAMIGTQGKYEATFGYFECRIQFQSEVGHWSAFWLQSPTVEIVGDTKTTGTEIDIFEYLRRHNNTVYMNLHWDCYGEHYKHAGSKYRKAGLEEGFHIIGLEWTPDEYVFYVDEKEVWRTDKAISQVKQYIILSLEVGEWAGDIGQAKLPDSLHVDYVRVYQIQQASEKTGANQSINTNK